MAESKGNVLTHGLAVCSVAVLDKLLYNKYDKMKKNMEKQNLKKVLMAFISACSFMPIYAQTGNFSFLQVSNGAQSDAAVLATGNENNKLIVRSELTYPNFCESFRLLHQFESNRNNGYIGFHRGESTNGGFLTFGSNGVERMRIDRYGNVGIGTTSPLAKLQINSGDNTDAAILATTTAGTKLMVKSLTENVSDGASFKLFHRFWSDDRNGYISFHRGGDTYGGFLEFGSNGLERMRIDGSGDVQIGTTNTTGNLTVNGIINAKEVTVKDPVWADFVFDKDYKLRDLKEVDQYIQENGHLPDIPSSAEVKENGVNLVEVQAKLLQKVEEMTLYILKQQKEIEELKVLVKQTSKQK